MDFLATHTIASTATGRQALEQLDQVAGPKVLFVLDDTGRLIGTLTDGDVRRGLLAGAELPGSVSGLMNPRFRALRGKAYSVADIRAFRAKGVLLVPLLDADGRLLRVADLSASHSLLPLDAVIMAGGRGERLRPLTDTTPKPLLLVGDKPIIEHNVDRLIAYGVRNLTITIKYLGEQLEEFFGDGSSKNARIRYTREDQALGTIGALALVEGLEHDTVLLMNSDLLTDIDFEDFYATFCASGAEMAVASVPYTVPVPYAVLEVDHERILSFKEKPTYTYYSNAGIYLIKRSLIERIPKGDFYNATDLMEGLIAEGRKVGYYPLLTYWLDVGKHEDYRKAQEDIRHLQL
ncbi:MAG: nucleotidyltransferase family protein [Hymenobacteraceae bacterium]|nr:nucleotidyltransferase family protein [Hymenobacteraceae bacterium]